MSKLRVVLDTNILISGLLLSSSTSQKVFDKVTATEIILIFENTFEEIYQTFVYEKFDKY